MRLFAALLLFAGSAGAAQDKVDVPQVSSSRPFVAAPEVPPSPKTTQPPQQLSNFEDSKPAEAQLAAPGTSNEQPRQVASRSLDPRAAEPLSTPEEGRTAAVDRVKGHDRCDPADAQKSKTLQCRKIIENRAAQYSRPSPTRLSPEQKLLIDQQLQANEEASRRLATSGEVDGSLEGMGIASIVLDRNKPDEPEKKPQPDPEAAAAAQAVLAIINRAPQ